MQPNESVEQPTCFFLQRERFWRVLAVVVVIAFVLGCSTSRPASYDALTFCEQQLNASARGIDQCQAEWAMANGRYEQLARDTNQTIGQLQVQLALTRQQEEFWRSTAENRSVTIGILQERNRVQDVARRWSFWMSIATLLAEIATGLMLHYLTKGLDHIETAAGQNVRRHRTKFYLSLALCFLITVVILVSSIQR